MASVENSDRCHLINCATSFQLFWEKVQTHFFKWHAIWVAYLRREHLIRDWRCPKAHSIYIFQVMATRERSNNLCFFSNNSSSIKILSLYCSALLLFLLYQVPEIPRWPLRSRILQEKHEFGRAILIWIIGKVGLLKSIISIW